MWACPPRKSINMETGQIEETYNKVLISDEQYDIVTSMFNIRIDADMSRVYVCNDLVFKIYPIFNK